VCLHTEEERVNATLVRTCVVIQSMKNACLHTEEERVSAY
jgi:hypothetical protein